MKLAREARRRAFEDLGQFRDFEELPPRAVELKSGPAATGRGPASGPRTPSLYPGRAVTCTARSGLADLDRVQSRHPWLLGRQYSKWRSHEGTTHRVGRSARTRDHHELFRTVSISIRSARIKLDLWTLPVRNPFPTSSRSRR